MFGFKCYGLLFALLAGCNLLPMQQSSSSTSALKPAGSKQKTANKKKKKNKVKSAAKATNPSSSASKVSSSSATNNKQLQPISKAKKAIVKAKKAIKPPVSLSNSSAACSSSSSPKTPNPTPISTPKKILIVDEAGIDALANKYKNPIPVNAIDDISEVKLTKETLKHIFGMEVGDNKDKLGSFYLTGFHHDQQRQLRDQENIYYFSRQGHEGFIAYTRQQFPVYKTFFSSMLPRETIISMMIEALQNIQNIEDQGHAFKIEGMAKNNMSIIIIIKKKNNTIITFFPKSQKTAQEIKEMTDELKKKFTKFFFNPSNQPLRQPITDEESQQLLTLYPKGIETNWIFAQVDSNTQDLYNEFFLLFHKKIAPFFESTVLNQDLIDEILDEDPEKIINIEYIINKINITPETLSNVFAEQNDLNFPLYLSRVKILEKLKDAIDNFLPKEDYDSEEDESNSQNELSNSDSNVEELKESDIDQQNNLNSSPENCSSGLPRYHTENGLIEMRLRNNTNELNDMDTFTFYIFIDPLTGNIIKFYPLFD